MYGQSAYRLSVNGCLTPLAQRQVHGGTESDGEFDWGGTPAKGLSAYRLSVSKGVTDSRLTDYP